MVLTEGSTIQIGGYTRIDTDLFAWRKGGGEEKEKVRREIEEGKEGWRQASSLQGTMLSGDCPNFLRFFFAVRNKR